MPRQGQNVGNHEIAQRGRAVGAEGELRACMEGQYRGMYFQEIPERSIDKRHRYIPLYNAHSVTMARGKPWLYFVTYL